MAHIDAARPLSNPDRGACRLDRDPPRSIDGQRAGYGIANEVAVVPISNNYRESHALSLFGLMPGGPIVPVSANRSGRVDGSKLDNK